MNREEAIEILEEEANYLYGDDEPYNRMAFDMAIEALKAQDTIDLYKQEIKDLEQFIKDNYQNPYEWIPCSKPPKDRRNAFIAHGAKDMMSVCIGHWEEDMGLWYEDRNWFASPVYDALYWCDIPDLPETRKVESNVDNT